MPVNGKLIKEFVMDGFSNWFVLENIFGESFDLNGKELYDMSLCLFKKEFRISIIIEDSAVNLPRKWVGREKFFAEISFYNVEDFSSHICSDACRSIPKVNQFVIKSFNMSKSESSRISVKTECETGDTVEFSFESGKVSRIKPW